MRRFFRIAMLGLILLLVAAMSALTAMRFAIHGREVAVPKLIGQSTSQAETLANDAGLILIVQDRFYSPTVAEGGIISQVPAAGTQVRKGWRIRVAQSLGPQRAQMPNVIGQSARAAEINIKKRGLELSSIATTSLSGATPGDIISQNPPANADSLESPRVSVLIAAPGSNQSYVMPLFTGQSLALALQQIESAGLQIGSVTDGSITVYPKNRALSAKSERAAKGASLAQLLSLKISRQLPAAGQRVSADSVIHLEVAR